MTRRATVTFAAAATLAAAGIAAVVVAPGRPAPGPHGVAADLARAACRDADRFTGLVQRNAPITDVKRALAIATDEAARATAADPGWAQLQSALETLGVALDHDDAGSANVGMRLLASRCSVFGGR